MTEKNLLYFCGGVVLGVAGTLSFLWFWEDERENVDIPEAVEVSEPLHQPVDKSTLDVSQNTESHSINYNDIVTALYGSKKDETLAPPEDGPKRIQNADELVENGHYDMRELTLYSDGILADSITDEIMSESDAFVALGPNYTPRELPRIFAIGRDSFYDTICIRNDALYTVYEISQDERTYKEVVGR